jgi:hypothetical protein
VFAPFASSLLEVSNRSAASLVHYSFSNTSRLIVLNLLIHLFSLCVLKHTLEIEFVKVIAPPHNAIVIDQHVIAALTIRLQADAMRLQRLQCNVCTALCDRSLTQCDREFDNSIAVSTLRSLALLVSWRSGIPPRPGNQHSLKR